MDFSDIQTSIIANNNIIEIKEDDVKIEIPLSEPSKHNLDIGAALVNIQSCYFVDKSIEALFVGPSRPQGDTEFPGKVTETVAACHQSDNLGNSTAFLTSGRQLPSQKLASSVDPLKVTTSDSDDLEIECLSSQVCNTLVSDDPTPGETQYISSFLSNIQENEIEIEENNSFIEQQTIKRISLDSTPPQENGLKINDMLSHLKSGDKNEVTKIIK